MDDFVLALRHLWPVLLACLGLPCLLLWIFND